MTDQERKAAGLPPETTSALINTALRRKKDGDLLGARALLRALAAQQPDEPRIWLALATVAETRAEQRQALERVIALDPQHPLAQRGLERFRGAAYDRSALAASAEGSADAAASLPSLSSSERRADAAFAPTVLRPIESRAESHELGWPLYIVIAIAVFAVLVAAGLLRLPQVAPAAGPAPTIDVSRPSPLPSPAAPAPSAAGAAPGATPDPAVLESTPAPAEASPTLPPTAAPASPTPSARPTEEPSLAPGTVIDRPPWHVSLLRPEYAVLLDGGIGTTQPAGRFLLALVAVSNGGPAQARMPPDLFALVDARGRRFLARPGASTLYLDTYGRGQRGDLSMEENIPPGGFYSVPLIFDVPADAETLTLHVGTERVGWRIAGATGTGAPTASPTALP